MTEGRIDCIVVERLALPPIRRLDTSKGKVLYRSTSQLSITLYLYSIESIKDCSRIYRIYVLYRNINLRIIRLI